MGIQKVPCGPCCVTRCPIMHQNHTPILTDVGNAHWKQNLILVTSSVEILVHNDSTGLDMQGYSRPDHHRGPTTETITFNYTVVCIAFTPSSVYPIPSVISSEFKPGFVCKQNVCPVGPCELQVTPRPLQSQPAMTLCQHNTYVRTSVFQASLLQAVSYSLTTDWPTMDANRR